MDKKSGTAQASRFAALLRRVAIGLRWRMLRAPELVVGAYLSMLARRAAQKPREPKLVVLVADLAGSRVCKIGYGLKLSGWRVILLHRGEPWSQPAKCFSQTCRYRSPIGAVLLAARFNPVAYHVFSSWDFEVASLFVRHKPGRIVFDDYDVLSGVVQDGLSRRLLYQIAQERACLENADGICCRNLLTQVPKRQLGYRYKGKRILLVDCCWDDEPRALSERDNHPGEFHIVNTTYVPLQTDGDVETHMHELGGLVVGLIAQGATARNFHFHLYTPPNVWSGAEEKVVSTNVESADARLFIHVHHPVPPDELGRECARYDAGLYHHRIPLNTWAYNQGAHRFAMGNKIFDYLDAGLPVIISDTKFPVFVLRRFGVDICVDNGGSDRARAYLQRPSPDLRRAALRARSSLAVVKHVPRLGLFYESL